MARIVTFAALLVGITAFLFLGGIASGSQFLTAVSFTNLSNLGGTNLAVTIGAIFTAVALVGVVVSFFTNRSTESYIVAAVSGTLLTMGMIDIGSIWGYMNTQCPALSDCSWATSIVNVMMAIFAGTFLISMVQWWRGNDI